MLASTRRRPSLRGVGTCTCCRRGACAVRSYSPHAGHGQAVGNNDYPGRGRRVLSGHNGHAVVAGLHQ
eukprot:55777-Eustigmatos_ZCMA.PRE.1